MASRLTRKELVLQLLRSHENEWIDGPQIASPKVGGSEGLKRLRELRMDGYDIRMRKHPDSRRDIFQYRLLTRAPKTDWAGNANRPVDHTSFGVSRTYEIHPFEGTTITDHPITPGMAGRDFPLHKGENGKIEVAWETCECGEKYAIKTDHLLGFQHKRWLALSQTIEGQTESFPEEPAPVIHAYTNQPVGIKFGDAVVCPRCKGHRRPARVLKAGFRPADEMCMDPHDHAIYCRRCNGWGLVPNIGPVASQEIPS